MEVPEGEREDVDQMAVESLREHYHDFDQRITRTWHHTETPHDMAMVSSVSVRSDVAETIVDDLKSVKLQCIGMDSLPFAMARAADMSSRSLREQPVALLDWGAFYGNSCNRQKWPPGICAASARLQRRKRNQRSCRRVAS